MPKNNKHIKSSIKAIIKRMNIEYKQKNKRKPIKVTDKENVF